MTTEFPKGIAANPYQPSPGQVRRSSPTGRRVSTTRDRTREPSNHCGPVHCRLRFQIWCASMTRHPTPIEAQAPPGRSAHARALRGLETQSCPRTGLLKQATSPKRIRYLRARGRGRVKREREMVVARRGWVSHHSTALPDPGFLITPRGGSRKHAITDELGPRTARVRRLAHPPSPRYAARNLSIEKTVLRDNMS